MPRKPIILILLSCYLLYVQGCTSRRLIPIEDLPKGDDQRGKIVAIGKIDGVVLKIDSKTGTVSLVDDSLRVKCNNKTPEIRVALTDIKQITVKNFSPLKTIVLTGSIITFMYLISFLMFPALDKQESSPY